MTGHEFEELGRNRLGELFKTKLSKRRIPPTKVWDYVSEGQSVVGDAKCFGVAGYASSEKSIISEHVWLLQNVSAQLKFLLFGNRGDIPLNWLRRWHKLLPNNIFFFYLESDGVDLKILYAPDDRYRNVWTSLVDDRGRWKK